MSNYCEKYKIIYDGNDGCTYKKEIYVKHEGVWNGQSWVNSDGTPLDFKCCTDSESYVTACCIAGKVIDDEYFYWEEIENFEIPEEVCKAFNYNFKLTTTE